MAAMGLGGGALQSAYDSGRGCDAGAGHRGRSAARRAGTRSAARDAGCGLARGTYRGRGRGARGLADVHAMGQLTPVRMRLGPAWARIIPLAGLVAVLAAWSKVLLTPGDMNNGDLFQPLVLRPLIEHIYPSWHPTTGSNLIELMRTGLVPPFYAIDVLLRLGPEIDLRLKMVAVLTAAYASAYWFLRSAAGEPVAGRVACALGSAFFAVNPWSILRMEHLMVLVQSAVVPLVLGLFATGLRTGSKRRIWGAGAVMALWGSTNPHYMVFTPAAIAVWTAWWVATGDAGSQPRLRRALGYGGLFAGSWFSAFAFALLPLLGTAIAGGTLT